MKVLLLGSGGREHALAWALRHSPAVRRLYAMPGSDAIATLGEPLAGDPSDAARVAAAAAELDIDLTVVGPEAPLAAGVADALMAEGRRVFGPSQAAARLESSKIFAKQFMAQHQIPTARFAACRSEAEARQALAAFPPPVVLKADGLAAGKGVVIARDRQQAESALAALFAGRLAGAAGQQVVIEECLEGEEMSLLALSDGERWMLLPPAQDHKRARDGDQGPNTGGMGAVSCDRLLTAELRRKIEQQIVAPVLRGMAAAGHPLRGVLYCGLMLTAEGPKVLEFNVRFGDPEAQAILARAEGDWASALLSVAEGQLQPEFLRWSPEPAACVVLASGGYPGAFATDLPIHGLEVASREPQVTVFHAGTALRDQHWVTRGGRVLGVTARAATLPAAIEQAYAAVEPIRFEGMQYRRDIGRRALAWVQDRAGR
ncbi:MAG: phosphoribosylamine--glycine ligase [Terriglobales bacterium]